METRLTHNAQAGSLCFYERRMGNITFAKQLQTGYNLLDPAKPNANRR